MPFKFNTTRVAANDPALKADKPTFQFDKPPEKKVEKPGLLGEIMEMISSPGDLARGMMNPKNTGVKEEEENIMKQDVARYKISPKRTRRVVTDPNYQ